MGASIGSDNHKGSVDVHLNIVPFIDLLSCLTAFLLVTAVWSNLAHIEVTPRGLARGPVDGTDEQVRASVHVTGDAIWVGLSRLNEFSRVDKNLSGYDWQELHRVLAEHKASPIFEQRRDIEIAADDDIPYQVLITAMDAAVSAGFAQVGLTDPGGLSARRQL